MVFRLGRKRQAPLEAGADRGERYRSYVSAHLSSSDADHAMKQAIGGEFDAMGAILCDLLIDKGLRPDGSVVDIGCGSGRVALPLSHYLDADGKYLGTDVVPDLLAYADKLTQRDSFRFETVDDFGIPADDDSADIVCFFSVMTHLRHEHSYLYLEEAKRVVRPSGRIVISFLEFAIGSHWTVFQYNAENPHIDKPLDQFMSRDGIASWAQHLGLEVVEFLDGDTPNVPLRKPVTMEHGVTYTDLGAVGQSVVVLKMAQP